MRVDDILFVGEKAGGGKNVEELLSDLSQMFLALKLNRLPVMNENKFLSNTA